MMGTPDWRLKISCPALGYGGILAPLAATGGVIFPYTPQIQVTYAAQYDNTPLTHSNYKVHMYSSSSVENVQVTGDFTAQDGGEAAYMLAVIHFFRSTTKMFYGNDALRGTPPPLCFISGIGEYHFNNHPLAVTSFSMSLPSDVDYIQIGSSGAPKGNNPSAYSAGPSNLGPGGGPAAPDFSAQSGEKTFVPVKMQISVAGIPVMSRTDVSNRFSLQGYATGELLKNGFW